MNSARASKRLINSFVDTIITLAIAYFIGLIIPLNSNVLKIAVALPYYILMEFYIGRTIGKMCTKTKVVMADGTKPTFNAILARSVIRLIPFDPLSFLGSNNPNGWHDKWSNTVVIEENTI
ncbi:MAG TPA: RDD family protein [Candidatus Andersenbacteria bacterium]|nr:RDD family protein [Candidatus Andersenbacteria bacterium]